jgi:hypothetical protein
MSTQLVPPDIFLSRGKGFISRAIRFFTRRIGESRTKVSHVGLVVERGGVREAVVIEAVSRVRRLRLFEAYGCDPSTQVAVFRPLNLTEDEIAATVRAAERYVGRRYSYFKAALHLADWFLQGAYVFRRLGRMEDYPICSWLVAHAYSKAGKTFGVAAGAASPDDIWDFVVAHPEKYQEILPLAPLTPDRETQVASGE